MRAAYYGGTALTGAGQNLGLLEFLGTDLADLKHVLQEWGQTNTVPITLLSTDGTSTSCTAAGRCDDTEQTLDMTQALGHGAGTGEPGDVYRSSDTAMISAMTTHNPLPTVIGCSWGWTPADPGTLDPFFQRMAAQGQNFFAASGDSSTGQPAMRPGRQTMPNIVFRGRYWTWLPPARVAPGDRRPRGWDSGGGISPDRIAIPSWQKLRA